MSELSDLLHQHKPDGWSARQVAREAEKKGRALSQATATQYFGGKHGVPDDSTIETFAIVLNIPINELRAAAGLRKHGEPWTPHPDTRYLRDDQRVALDQLISTMIDRREDGTGDVAAPAEKTPGASGGGAVIDLAGRQAPPVPADAAADDPGVPSEYTLRTDQQDADAESPQDPDPGSST